MMFPNQQDFRTLAELPSGPGAYRTEVSKTYVPGKGFQSASKLGVQGLKAAAKARKQPQPTFRQQNAHVISTINANKKLAQGVGGSNPVAMKGKRGTVTRLTTTRRKLVSASGGDLQGVAFHTGGRRGPRTYVTTPGKSKALQAHELQHVAPKRSSWRYNQVLADPKKHMAEEARADVAAGNHYRKGRPNMSTSYHMALAMPKMHTNFAAANTPRGAAVYGPGGTRNDAVYYRDMHSKESLQQGRAIQDRMQPKYKRKKALNSLVQPRQRKSNGIEGWSGWD